MTQKVQPSLSNISLNLKSGALSLQEQLYQKILELIELKSLCPGDPIPSSRRLASEIAVSRSTVVSVYNRLLEEGLLETKNGNGTFVSEISLGVFENRKENGSTNEKFLPSELPLSAKIAAAASEFKVQKRCLSRSSRLIRKVCRAKIGPLSLPALLRVPGCITATVIPAASCLTKKLFVTTSVNTEV